MTSRTEHTPEWKTDVARKGRERFGREIQPHLNPEDYGKFIAIDVLSGEYEIDEDDLTALNRLAARLPDAEVYLMRAGHDGTYRLYGIGNGESRR